MPPLPGPELQSRTMQQRALLLAPALRQLRCSYAQPSSQTSAAIASCTGQHGAASGIRRCLDTARASSAATPRVCLRPTLPRQYSAAAQAPQGFADSEGGVHLKTLNPETGEGVKHGGSRAMSLAVPTFMVWGANTDVGKTLVSAGLAAAAVRAQARPTPSNRAMLVLPSPPGSIFGGHKLGKVRSEGSSCVIQQRARATD